MLAAGASKRLGRPKQLLPFKGTTLLAYMVDLVTAVVPSTVVVLGANRDEIEHDLQLHGLNVSIACNPDWEEGMASSIRCGLQELLLLEPDVTGVFFTVCDQPFLTKSLLWEMKTRKHKTRKRIIACRYSSPDSLGTPVLFDRSLLEELFDLQGDAGAKKVVLKHLEDVEIVSFPLGRIDVDTEHDYDAIKTA